MRPVPFGSLTPKDILVPAIAPGDVTTVEESRPNLPLSGELPPASEVTGVVGIVVGFVVGTVVHSVVGIVVGSMVGTTGKKVKSFASIPSCPSGLVTTTFQLPASCPVRSNVQVSCVDKRAVTLVAAISEFPVRFSFTEGLIVVLKLMPERFVILTTVVLLPPEGAIPVMAGGGTGAAIMKPFSSVPGAPPGLVTTTLYAPSVAFVRSKVQVIVEPECTAMLVAGMEVTLPMSTISSALLIRLVTYAYGLDTYTLDGTFSSAPPAPFIMVPRCTGTAGFETSTISRALLPALATYA